MSQHEKSRIWTVIALVVVSCVILFPTFFKSSTPEWWPSKPMKLGLDLRGGSYLVLGVQTEEAVKSYLNTVAGALRAELRAKDIRIVRARQVRMSELEFVLLSDRSVPELEEFLRVEYPELKKVGDRRDEGRVIVTFDVDPKKVVELEKNSVTQAIETIRNRIDQYGVAEPTIQRSGEKHIIVQLPDITNIDNVKKTIGSVAKLEFQLVADIAGANTGAGTVSRKNREGGELLLEEEVLMSGDAIRTANVDINPQTNEVEVVLRLNGVGAKTFDRVTSESINRRLAIVLDNIVQSSPNIRERISGGVAQISGGFSADEAHRLAIVLRSGALPAPLEFLEERTVGATLGADSIRSGVISMAIGTVLVVLFVIWYYRKVGLLAVGCLTLNVLFLLAVLALLGATLTLPGIAGLVLTVGMAVDANVIIFERIREELRNGATPKAAVLAGFNRAHWTILDSNITTFLSGMVLYGLGTGPIKGFAVTLCMGVLTSVFSALFVSRVGFEVLNLRNQKGELSI